MGWVLFGAVVAGICGAGVIMAHESGERSRDAADPSPAFDYGPNDATYFKLRRTDPKPDGPLTLPIAGIDLLICWEKITWNRPIEMVLKVWFLDAYGRQDDYDDSLTVHDIHPAPQMGPFPSKCRAWKLPAGLAPGAHIMTGVARPKNPQSKSVPVLFPRVAFVVK